MHLRFLFLCWIRRNGWSFAMSPFMVIMFLLQGVSFVAVSVCVLHVSAIRPRAGRWACLASDGQIQSLLINSRSKRCGCGWNEDRKRLCAITPFHDRVWLMIALAPQNVSGWSSWPSGDSVFHSSWLFFFTTSSLPPIWSCRMQQQGYNLQHQS